MTSILDTLIYDLNKRLYPRLPSFISWFLNEATLQKILIDNKEEIKEWLKTNQNLINQL